jgi:pyruvate formate lyase activating enzyme
MEFVQGCCHAAEKAGLANVLVTNGYVNPEPAADLLPHVQALNLDIKSMDDAFYRELCGASLAPVLAFAVQAIDAGCHVEITNLLVTGRNDTDEHVERLAVWIAEHLGKRVPLHLSAYFPRYQLDAPPTSPRRVHTACSIARKHLQHVHAGNV